MAQVANTPEANAASSAQAKQEKNAENFSLDGPNSPVQQTLTKSSETTEGRQLASGSSAAAATAAAAAAAAADKAAEGAASGAAKGAAAAAADAAATGAAEGAAAGAAAAADVAADEPAGTTTDTSEEVRADAAAAAAEAAAEIAAENAAAGAARSAAEGAMEGATAGAPLAAAAAAAAADAAAGEAAAKRSSVDVRIPYERPRSRKLNRTSSYQCHVDMAGWLQAFPHMTLSDLGPGFAADSFCNGQGLRLATYAWRQTRKAPKAAVVLFHSYTSYALFDFLRHQPPEGDKLEDATQEEENWVPKFHGSWIEAFYQLGMNVYAMDHQSHGRSEGWRQWRCNVSKFDYLVDDGIQFLSETVCGDPQLPEDVPIVLVGYSMGGNVVIQCLGRIYACEKLLAIKSRVTQAVLLAPLIKIKLDWKTKLMLMINRSLISCWLPNLRFSRAENSGDCPFLGWWYDKDPFTYSGRTKSRMGAALFDASRKLPRILRGFPPQLKLLCLQGTHDQTVDFHAPLKLYESPVKLDLLYLCGWSHYIPKQSGADRLIDLVTAWMVKTLGGKVHPLSPHAKLFSLTKSATAELAAS
ncbi:acylglycerol lipase, putative [Eimeria tenella]|uniref:Acylglycerol lipase, putative n=1 Tax=Eimeria tenella TaxID=5802 RepID=H9B9M3_EIMTE|nr:acylglycerol lipase, putative [Eimeria tenella]AET50683.1 hypothetical protein [Eimeria tenella]CDJ41178.1 acylglycerol lipase, putative [Eimeria tenella]|eukprot:XP_013231928.1 acylglycerol lipase, putative [Eimeria tenella]